MCRSREGKSKGNWNVEPAGELCNGIFNCMWFVLYLSAKLSHSFKIGKLRTREDSITGLKDIYKTATTVGGITKLKKLKTMHGLQDKYQEYYVDKITHYMQSLDRDTGLQKQVKVDEFVKHLPPYPMNPVFRIKGKWVALTEESSNLCFEGLNPNQYPSWSPSCSIAWLFKVLLAGRSLQVDARC